ncbi:MAG: hypothetical protein IPL84_02400 [Chitinophagaceae bacterium]|nr:hypothetical protein [Chitinophagaceae bacterium]
MIETLRVDFEHDIYDTNRIEKNLGTKLATTFHKKTLDKVIQKNLFFKEGERLSPYLLADNERYLRTLEYIKDARILVEFTESSNDSVDVLVITKDVFSIGLNLSISSPDNGRFQLREENLLGTGDRVSVNGYYENPRSPNTGIGGEFIKRNIGGSFVDFVSGYRDYDFAFTSGRNQETIVYARLEKPLVTAYKPSTGALEWSYQRTRNVYADTLYESGIKYQLYNLDAWFGYSLGNKRALLENRLIQIHQFIAIRGIKQHFLKVPAKYVDSFDYRFTDFTGGLASFNIFRQSFYKSSFLYGFGRSEDIPEGFSIAATAGFIKRRNIGRPYTGIDVAFSNFSQKGFYSSYTFRVGGYFNRKRFEDVDLLFEVDHFTRLRKLSKKWYNRIFVNTGITSQVNPVFNTPLFLNSEFGLPYFSNGTLSSDLRATVKGETVFYNMTKILGFRFAPFLLVDAVLLKPSKQGLEKIDLFTAIGGGIRTRNENMVFGTIELKGYYFPRTNGDMKPWQVELSSNIRFPFNRNFISRPDFIQAN